MVDGPRPLAVLQRLWFGVLLVVAGRVLFAWKIESFRFSFMREKVAPLSWDWKLHKFSFFFVCVYGCYFIFLKLFSAHISARGGGIAGEAVKT